MAKYYGLIEGTFVYLKFVLFVFTVEFIQMSKRCFYDNDNDNIQRF